MLHRRATGLMKNANQDKIQSETIPTTKRTATTKHNPTSGFTVQVENI